jgi:hypothetical protein
MTYPYDWSIFVDRLRRALAACDRLGGETRPLIIEPPAREVDVRATEAAIGLQLPSALRETLLTFSQKVDMRWYLPDHLKAPFPGVFSGCVDWDLRGLAKLEQIRREWVETCFSDCKDPYHAVWHDKLTFHTVPNGDMLALDLRSVDHSPVIYLSHEGDESNGYELGYDFIDYIDRLSRLGCPGSEDWQLMPFMVGPKSHLDPECPNARKWLDWFGM